jgi:flavin reductase (DIM6/NTAB) family NADH-FMN oxidoreductase RutF
LLAPTFTASIQTARGTEQYDRATFANMLTRVLNAATTYKSAAKCSAPVIAGTVATVACEVHESLTILKKNSEGISSDTHKIALVDGAAKFVSIDSIQRDK